MLIISLHQKQTIGPMIVSKLKKPNPSCLKKKLASVQAWEFIGLMKEYVRHFVFLF